MTELTKMQTHCVGRLLIDLPEGTEWEPTASGAHLDGYLALRSPRECLRLITLF